jgi:CRP-like cAMP-binding protein
MTELEQYLRTYMGISDDDMEALVNVFHPLTLEKGDYLLKAGRPCERLCFHREGLIRVFADHGEKEVTQWISYKGTLITDLQGLVCDEPARFSMQALSHCELYSISKKDYLDLHRRVPRWPVLERTLITRCFGIMEERVFALLSMTAEERYIHLQEVNPELFELVPLKYLASMMGMTPESLSRIRKKK